jgi:hypothetical protein
LESALDDAVEMWGDKSAVGVDARKGRARVEGVAGWHEEVVGDPGGEDGDEDQPRSAALASSHKASISSRVS